jgi:UDP:flavonoid glycosyltransferase YjiC (YdhE family)
LAGCTAPPFADGRLKVSNRHGSVTLRQAANAGRLGELGLGERLEVDMVSAETLRAAISKVASDAAVRVNLVGMRQAILGSGGVTRGADVIEQYLR